VVLLIITTGSTADFDLEALILGIERMVYGEMVAQRSKKMEVGY